MRDEKGFGPTIYRMHVIARDAADLVANVGGLIVDRMMSGWRVSVQLLESDPESGDTRPVQILGAELVDAVESSCRQDEDQYVLVMGADSYGQAISGDGRQLLAWCTEVLVWGESPDPSQLFGYNPSAAARAFKTQAVAAADLTADGVTIAEAFTSMKVKAAATQHA